MHEIEKLRLMVVEDDVIVGTHLSELLNEEGYAVQELFISGESALEYLETNSVDLVLMDVKLAGKLDGIETAIKIHDLYQTPVIFLTANSDKLTFERSKEAYPFAFIQKPFKPKLLLQTIEVVLNKIYEEADDEKAPQAKLQLDDRIFIRDQNKLVRIQLKDILYVEAERNYCHVVTEGKTFLLSVPLKNFAGRLGSAMFQRTHRSFLANLLQVDAIDEFGLIIKGNTVPVSRQYKSIINKQLNVM